MGCNVLVRDGLGFTWLPSKIAGQLGIPEGPLLFKPDGSFIRCKLENDKPLVNKAMVDAEGEQIGERKAVEAETSHDTVDETECFDEVLETFSVIRQGCQERAVLREQESNPELRWLNAPGAIRASRH